MVGRAPTKSEKEHTRTGLIARIMAGAIDPFYTQYQKEKYQNNEPLVFGMAEKISNSKDDKKPNTNKLLNKLREILRREKKPFKN